MLWPRGPFKGLILTLDSVLLLISELNGRLFPFFNVLLKFSMN